MSRRKHFAFTDEASAAVLQSSVRDEILRKTRDDGVTTLTSAKLIALDRLHPDPLQPRRHFDQPALQELAASLLADGVQSPISAYYDDERDAFIILTGERRWRAAAIAGLARLPVLIQPRPDSPADTLGKQLAENLLRADLTELEKAQALARLRELQPQSWVELARSHGLSDRRLYQMVSLIDAPQPLQQAIQERRISGRHARALARLPESQQVEALVQVIERDLPARATEELIKSLLAPAPSVPPTEPDSSAAEQGAYAQAETAPGGTMHMLPADINAEGDNQQAHDKQGDEASSEQGILVPERGPTTGAVAAVLEGATQQEHRRQVRRFTGRVEAMEAQLRNLRVGELLPRVQELPEYVERMRSLRAALDAYIEFLERVHLDAPGAMQPPEPAE